MSGTDEMSRLQRRNLFWGLRPQAPGIYRFIPARIGLAILTALKIHPKSVWLCSSRTDAEKYKSAVSTWLNKHGFVGHPTWLLSSLGDEIDEFKASPQGHLFVAGRFDGMDFKANECRLVVVTTLPR